jgi:hypothetical protein
MFTVYRINTFPIQDNSYCVGRSESWNIKKDKDFNSLEEAKDYVREKSRMFTNLPLFLINFEKQEDKDKFVDEFCFDNKYLKYQRFFIGNPDTNKIVSHLKEKGINVKKGIIC